MQAVLEGVKNPAIKDVGVTMKTVSTYDYLLELGVPGRYLNKFFKQPIIQEYAKLMEADASMFTLNRDAILKNNKQTGSKLFEAGIVYKLMMEWMGNKWTPDMFQKSQEKLSFYKSLTGILDLKEVSYETLRDGLTTTKASKGPERVRQCLYLHRFLQYKAQAGDMFQLVQYIGDDTANIKTFAEQKMMERNKQKVKDLGMIEDLDALVKSSFISEIKESKNSLEEGFKNYFLTMQYPLSVLIDRRLDKLDKKFIPTEDKKDDINRFGRAGVNYLVQTRPHPSTGKTLIDDAKELLIGKNSMGNRFAKLQERFKNDLFLSYLQPLLSQAGLADGVRPINPNDTPDDVAERLLTVLQNSRGFNPEKQEYRDALNLLESYIILQAGGQPGRNSLKNYLPDQLIKITRDLINDFIKTPPDLNYDLIEKQFEQNYYPKSPVVSKLEQGEFETYFSTQTTSPGLLSQYFIMVPLRNAKSDSDMVWRYQANPGLSRDQKKLNRNAGNGLNGANYLYERIPGAVKQVMINKVGDDGNYQKSDDFQIFKRINTKGLYGFHNLEWDIEDYKESIHKQNLPFNELLPIIQKEIEALIWKSPEKDVSLQSSTLNESINSEEPTDNMDTNMNDDSIQKDGSDNIVTNTSDISKDKISDSILPNTRAPHEPGSEQNPHKIPMNFADGTGGRAMRPEFKGKSTMDLIKSGDRTATSRDRSKAYNQQDIRVGDYINFYSDKGEHELVQATTAPYPVKSVSPERWSKLEGWAPKQYAELAKKGYDQFQFKRIGDEVAPTLSSGKTKIFSPYPGVESIPNSGLTIEQANNFIDLLQPQILKQAYVENKAYTANRMFSFGLRWAKNVPNETEKSIQRQEGLKQRPNKVAIKSPARYDAYGYYRTDQNNQSIPSIKELQPIMDFIQSKLGIDMKNYDSVLANIYESGSFIHQHRDITESITAKNYPVIVINLGAEGGLIYHTDFSDEQKYDLNSNTYSTFEINKNAHARLPISNGGIYAFGVNGINRFTFNHRVEEKTQSTPTKPIFVPVWNDKGEKMADKELKNYRITLTFRRAQDIKDELSTPERIEQNVEKITPSSGKTQLSLDFPVTPDNIEKEKDNIGFKPCE